MSDRSAFTLVVYDCPPEQRPAVLGVINEHGLNEDYGLTFGDSEDEKELVLGEAYGYDEMQLLAYQDVADEIIKAAPGATFECWNDPKYEYNGAITMYAPDLGLYTHDCDSEGNLTFSAQEVEEALAMQPSGTRDAYLGKPWEQRFSELRVRLAGVA